MRLGRTLRPAGHRIASAPCAMPIPQKLYTVRAQFFSPFSLHSELDDRAQNAECPRVVLPTKRTFPPPRSTEPEAENAGR